MSSVIDRYAVVSADGHAGPPVREYRKYIPQNNLHDFDDYVSQVEAFDEQLATMGSAVPTVAPGGNVRASLNGNKLRGLWNPDDRIAEAENDGIVAEVLFPQGSVPFHVYPAINSVPGLGEVRSSVGDEAMRAGIRAYNSWLAEFCGAYPGRFAGVGIAPMGDVAAAVREVEWMRAAGLSGGLSLPAIAADRAGYNDRIYDPLWEACEALGQPLNVHGGGVRTPFYGQGKEARALRLCETDWYMRRTLWFMVFGGVFERYPRLRLTFTEQRTHWMGPLLVELDSIYEAKYAECSDYLPRRPSEYVRSNVYLGASFLSHSEAMDRSGSGPDRIMWGSDYPHVEGTWPFTRESLRMTFAGLPEEDVRMMVGGNAIECFGFDDALLRGIADRVGPTLEELNEPLSARPTGSEMSWGFRENGPWS